MRITKITAYRQDQPFRDGAYTCSGGRSALGFDSTIIRIDTDAGLAGWGEMAPLGAFYDPSFAAGARAALAELAPALVGQDPLQVSAISRRMDHVLKGHPYAKSAIDMACWDLAGKNAGQPLAELLGGRFGETVALYRSVSQAEPARMAEQALRYVDAGAGEVAVVRHLAGDVTRPGGGRGGRRGAVRRRDGRCGERSARDPRRCGRAAAVFRRAYPQ